MSDSWQAIATAPVNPLQIDAVDLAPGRLALDGFDVMSEGVALAGIATGRAIDHSERAIVLSIEVPGRADRVGQRSTIRG